MSIAGRIGKHHSRIPGPITLIIERYRRRANRRIYPKIFWAYDWRVRVRVKAFKLDSPRTIRFRWLRLSLLTNRFPDPIRGV
jgi:hypothetical protein